MTAVPATMRAADDPAQIVEATIQAIGHIASPPEVTLRLIELLDDPSSSVEELHKIISGDPALCSRMLKVVNSSFYGLPRQIGSLNRAIVLLGRSAVRNLAIAAGVSKPMQSEEIGSRFAVRDLWMHSTAVATCAKLICDRLKIDLCDEAFLAGLIHDIGIIVEIQADRARFVKVLDEMTFDDVGNPTCDMRQVERQVYGADHEQFGAGLCDMWKFPESFAHVTGRHHDPLSLPEDVRTVACVVAAADRIAAQAGFGFRADIQSLEVPEALRHELGMSARMSESFRLALPKATELVRSTFN